ncbi:inner-membrane translocator [Natronococcus amylolyticus DSM 10524]|uniref:Inner-membrane translocator n=1 Tax=Natronococcus amylolyticus DSM 10524 TaxID=1227497 RepID=L9X6F2_9EURY|nr:ABC transporter permease [Natronococcus amylolyticus]ELY57290.1 inner-membrane translocator [Natronococcus amylolyticus DSM 10524]
MLGTAIQQLLDGITLGLVYVLLAAGLSVIFGVMNVINFAHGELAVLGAYLAVALTIQTGIGSTAFVAALVIAPFLVGIIGVALERYTVQPLYGRNPLYHILLTFGLVLVINDLVYLIWGTGSFRLPRPGVLTGTIGAFGLGISSYNVFMIVSGTLMAFAVWALLEYTKYGLIIRAGSQDRQMVRNLGIEIDRYYSLVFGVGAGLAAFAGIILAGNRQANPELGMSIIIPAFVIVVLGGLGSFKGAVVGGLLVGILQESILRPWVPWLEGMVIFVLMIAILLIRPHGLFGTELAEEGGSERLLAGRAGGLLERETRLKLGLVMIGVLALVPIVAGLLGNQFWVTFGSRVLVWALFALSLDFVMGYTGLVSLGHALFLGLGAYAVVLGLIHVTSSVFVALALAIALSAAIAWIVGFLSIRVAGVYFAMITLAFAELYYNLLYRLEITGGSEGLGLIGHDYYYGIAGVGASLDDVAFFVGPVVLTGHSLFYYVVLGALVASYFVTRRMLQSPFGSVLKSIRENEERATFLGYNTIVYKRRAFVVSGAFAGLAGGLFALNNAFVSPSAAEWLKSGEVIVMVILGGMGTLYGPIIGAGAFFGLEQLLTHYTGRWRLVLGTIFVLFVIFLPRGLVSVPTMLAPYLPGGPGPAADPGQLPEEAKTEGDD